MSDGQRDPWIGTRIREYEILELLGKGGMGSVYRARHAYLEEERAIKIIHGRHTGDAGFIDRFIREAKILTRLRHPNLLQLFEFGTLEGDFFFMVMELIRGESVWHRLRRLGRIPIPEAVKIIREAASGLQCAHLSGIIHRDISPDNLVLLLEHQQEITKVIDFGIAKPVLENTLELTAANLFIGKPQYCSPEQCMVAESKRVVDARSDIYSLAITFYQMLTGNLPFHSKSPQGYFLKHANEIPDPPSTHFTAGSFPEVLDRIVMKALSKRPEERHQNLGEFIADLDEFSNQRSPSIPIFSEPEIGEVFAGRYFIEKKLGRGEMGMVFKAIDKILEIPVALKTVSFDISEDEKMHARFKREVILARKVSHTNVCRVYDIGESAGVHYVSMEFVEGRTLAEYLRAQGRLSPEHAIPLLEQVLYAIRETHRAGIIHRDLKPQNIMIDSQMRLKIMDFGISLSPDFSRITQTGSLVGTPHYMAPEVFEEKPVDQRADLYSLGVLMYNLLTGRLPFDGPTPIAVLYAHLKADPPKPSEIVPSFPPALERMILKALQKDPEGRYQTADEILHDLTVFTQPSSDPRMQASEQLTHKLIAEHKYSKAIKVLQSLLQKQPENLRWKRLLKSSIAEKTKRDIQRTRGLIRSKNWIQAEYCLERIGGAQLEVTGVLNQLSRLQTRLIEGKKLAVGTFINEAEERLHKQDYLGAMASVESAWHLQPNDPAIIQMQERIQTAQQTESEQRLERKLGEAHRFLLMGHEEQAFLIAQDVLAEDPTQKAAKALRDQILESRWQKMQDQITTALELAIQPLTFGDFEVASELLSRLQQDLEIESCRKEIERIRAAILSLEKAFQSQQLFDITPIVKQLFSRDPFGWLEAHRSVFTEIENRATEQLEQRQNVVRDALLEGKRLRAEGDFLSALSKMEAALNQWDIPELQEFREQTLDAYRESKLEKAQEFAARFEWEEAIACWKEVLYFSPQAEDIQKSIVDAEHHISNELEIQKSLLRQLKNCYSLILNEQWTEAQNLAESMLKEIQPGFRLIEIEHEVERLQAEIQMHNRDRQKQVESVAERLNEAGNLYKKGAYSEAQQRISMILDTEFLQEETLELKIAVERAMQAQSVVARFQSAVQKGKEYFEKRDWQKAIEFWEKACSLSEEPYVKEWIQQAEQKWKKERHIRLSILAMLAEADELIFYKKFADAERKIDKCRKALTDEFRFEDLVEQLNKLDAKLRTEMDKEESARAMVQTDLEQAALLYHQKLYSQALRQVEKILFQNPELEAAMQLKEQIESAEAANTNVLEILRAVVKLVVKRDTKRLPNLLLHLKENARHTPYAEDCESIIDEIPLLVLEIESGDRGAVLDRMGRLFTRSLLLLEYEQTLRTFVASLEMRDQKEAALRNCLEEGLLSLEAGDRTGALECLNQFHRIVTGKRKQPSLEPDPLERTATLSDDDLKLSENELETLQSSLLQHELQTILTAARNILSAGDKTKAQELFQKALEIDPNNPAAREGLRQLQTE